MNCKPGDLCRILPAIETRHMGMVDRFVTVQQVVLNYEKVVSWTFEGPVFRFSDGEEIDCIPDRWLRPIDNPGEDARDETLSWLPVPDREVVHG